MNGMTFLRTSMLALLLTFVGLSTAVFAVSVVETFVYNGDSKPQVGSIVMLANDDAEVVLAVQEQSKPFGVVVTGASAVVGEESERTVFVQSDGTAQTLVSDANGPISIGDVISVSPITGVGQKGEVSDSTIGTALEPFNQESDVVATKSITSADGEDVRANIGLISVQLLPRDGNSSFLPEFITTTAETLAGKPVNTSRIVIALSVVAVTAAACGGLLFGSVRSAIIAIGRNPLSRGAIYKGLFQALVFMTLIFTVGMFTAVVILRI